MSNPKKRGKERLMVSLLWPAAKKGLSNTVRPWFTLRNNTYQQILFLKALAMPGKTLLFMSVVSKVPEYSRKHLPSHSIISRQRPTLIYCLWGPALTIFIFIPPLVRKASSQGHTLSGGSAVSMPLAASPTVYEKYHWWFNMVSHTVLSKYDFQRVCKYIRKVYNWTLAWKAEAHMIVSEALGLGMITDC